MPFYENVYLLLPLTPEVPPLTTAPDSIGRIEISLRLFVVFAGFSSTMGTTNFISKCLLYVSAVSNLKIFVKFLRLLSLKRFKNSPLDRVHRKLYYRPVLYKVLSRFRPI